MQPESAMRGGGRRERSKGRGRRGGECLCWRDAWGKWVNMCRKGGISVEKDSDIGSVAVRVDIIPPVTG